MRVMMPPSCAEKKLNAGAPLNILYSTIPNQRLHCEVVSINFTVEKHDGHTKISSFSTPPPGGGRSPSPPRHSDTGKLEIRTCLALLKRLRIRLIVLPL